MRSQKARCLWSDNRAAVAPVVALSMIGLIATGGLAFDYARLASMDSELQNAADQAALAAASQLDGSSGAMQRAEAAARSLLENQTRMANNGGGLTVTVNAVAATTTAPPPIEFFSTRADAEGGTNGFVDVSRYADAKFVRVSITPREAFYALTPIVAAVRSGLIGAEAVAGIGSSICKVPPVMICNPDEPSSNTNENLPFSPTRGVGLRLVTGTASVPGNFGWLEAGLANGTPALAAALGYNTPPGDCQPVTGVTTKPGMDAAVLNAFNTRFDVFANGNTTCPSQGGGICSPAVNTRKDLVCDPDNTNALCTNETWKEAEKPYRPYANAVGSPLGDSDGNGVGDSYALPSDPALNPSVMGYPRDYCHALPLGQQKCGIRGTGDWDRNAYFRVNYGWTSETAWQSGTKLGASASRYDVYRWELLNPSVTVGGLSRGIGTPQIVDNNEAAFAYPATGRSGVAASASQPDRRVISAAVLNCQALTVKGRTSNVPVPTWLELFLIEPAVNRADKKGVTYTDQKDIYVEMIGTTTATSSGGAGQVVRRDVPYLIR